MAKTNNVRVTFQVIGFPKGTEEIFISGNIPKLGNWDIENAIKLKQTADGKIFEVSVMIPKDTILEYKYTNHKDWETAEIIDMNRETYCVKSYVQQDIITGFNL